MKHSQGAMEGASSLRTLVSISSGPHALLGFKLFKYPLDRNFEVRDGIIL